MGNSATISTTSTAISTTAIAPETPRCQDTRYPPLRQVSGGIFGRPENAEEPTKHEVFRVCGNRRIVFENRCHTGTHPRLATDHYPTPCGSSPALRRRRGWRC